MAFLNYLLCLVAEGEPVTVSWSNIINANSFDGMMSGINSALPIVVPVGITVVGLGIVWKLIKKFTR